MKTDATIYLADKRGCSQSHWFRSYHTFSFNGYSNPDKKHFGKLIGVNDDTLQGGRTLSFRINQAVEILLVPVVGTIEYRSESGLFDALDAGESNLIFLEAGDELSISNPFENDLINFLHIWRIRHHDDQPDTIKSDFDPDANRNQFSLLASSRTFKSYLGKFDGRVDYTFKTTNRENGIFAFILEGAFEVQNRLLEPRDGLALAGVTAVEFEALSNNAIIILLEVGR